MFIALTPGLDAPDLTSILGDSSVGAELAAGGHVHDGHLGPKTRVLKERVKSRNPWIVGSNPIKGQY